MPWAKWVEVVSMSDLVPGSVRINVAEFLAALITCETFSSFCAKKCTTLEIDNRSAISWLNSARCPKYPFDRCAQGVHLHMLKNDMKLVTSWVPSEVNKLADTFSRKLFSMKVTGHCVAGVRLLKVRPKWHHVQRFI